VLFALVRPLIRKLVEQGYLTEEDDWILPTRDAIRSQDPSLSDADAAKLLAAARKALKA
jgi:hypothetical protein